MRVKAFLLAGALASAGPIAAQDTETRQLTDHQQMVHDIYRDIIGFRTARGHQQVEWGGVGKRGSYCSRC